MRTTKSYDKGYKEQAVKLIKEVGVKRASGELGVPQGTLYGWVKAAEHGELDIGERTPGKGEKGIQIFAPAPYKASHQSNCIFKQLSHVTL